MMALLLTLFVVVFSYEELIQVTHNIYIYILNLHLLATRSVHGIQISLSYITTQAVSKPGLFGRLPTAYSSSQFRQFRFGWMYVS